MKHSSILIREFLELYIKAHYFRPDGGDRDYETYKSQYTDLLEEAAQNPFEVLSFSFTYFRGNSNFPLLDLKTTLTTNCPKDQLNKFIELLDIDGGECNAEIQTVPNGDNTSFIITEQY